MKSVQEQAGRANSNASREPETPDVPPMGPILNGHTTGPNDYSGVRWSDRIQESNRGRNVQPAAHHSISHQQSIRRSARQSGRAKPKSPPTSTVACNGQKRNRRETSEYSDDDEVPVPTPSKALKQESPSPDGVSQAVNSDNEVLVMGERMKPRTDLEPNSASAPTQKTVATIPRNVVLSGSVKAIPFTPASEGGMMATPHTNPTEKSLDQQRIQLLKAQNKANQLQLEAKEQVARHEAEELEQQIKYLIKYGAGPNGGSPIFR